MPHEGRFQRQFLLCRNMAKQGNEVSLYAGRHIDSIQKSFFGCSRRKTTDGVNCVLINGTLSKSGINVGRIISMISFEIFLFFKTFFVAKSRRPDVIIASSLSLFTFNTARVLKRRFKCKLITEVRDIWPESPIQAGRLSENNLFVRILRSIEFKGYKNSDGIISPIPKFNEYVKKKLPQLQFRFCHIPQGFDESLFDGLGEFTKPKGKFNLCYSGSIAPGDRLDVVLDGVIGTNCPDIELTVIGSGPLKEFFIEKYHDYNNIVFLDPIPKNEMLQFLKNFDVLVMAWRDLQIYEYGISPNKMIDYLLSGKPIINAFNGYHDFLEEVGCGKYVDSNDTQEMANTIIDFYKMSREKLIEMGEKGRNYALENLNYNKLAAKLLDFIGE